MITISLQQPDTRIWAEHFELRNDSATIGEIYVTAYAEYDTSIICYEAYVDQASLWLGDYASFTDALDAIRQPSRLTAQMRGLIQPAN